MCDLMHKQMLSYTQSCIQMFGSVARLLFWPDILHELPRLTVSESSGQTAVPMLYFYAQL